MRYDVFICHAHEDKEALVRPLSDALRNARLEVWYDEFSLLPGDSLRRAIDLGLTKSQFGIVVISEAFFGKQWPQWELDGLVQRQMGERRSVIIPIWFGVGQKAVREFSPPLADKVALRAEDGIPALVREILRVIRPDGSSLLTAHKLLGEVGLNCPVITDDWWLDLIERAAGQDTARWYFPVPAQSTGQSPRERGGAIVLVAMQDAWQNSAEIIPITQMSHPNDVLRFIEDQPGLHNCCQQFPARLAMYAPQLTIRGFGGPFERQFDEMLAASVRRYENQNRLGSTVLAQDGAQRSCCCDEEIALRHPTFGNYTPAMIACCFVQGPGAGFGPLVRAFDTIDYVCWFLSDVSTWLPQRHHAFLLDGMKHWTTWHHWRSEGNCESGERAFFIIVDGLSRRTRSAKPRLPASVSDLLAKRIAESATTLCLPESPEVLLQRFIAAGFIEAFRERELTLRKR